jgi:hypothetical protein
LILSLIGFDSAGWGDPGKGRNWISIHVYITSSSDLPWETLGTFRHTPSALPAQRNVIHVGLWDIRSTFTGSVPALRLGWIHDGARVLELDLRKARRIGTDGRRVNAVFPDTDGGFPQPVRRAPPGRDSPSAH